MLVSLTPLRHSKRIVDIGCRIKMEFRNTADRVVGCFRTCRKGRKVQRRLLREHSSLSEDPRESLVFREPRNTPGAVAAGRSVVSSGRRSVSRFVGGILHHGPHIFHLEVCDTEFIFLRTRHWYL